jgi:hypothetical protein
MHAVLGIMFGIGLVALLGAVHLATQDQATVTGGLNAAWGRSHSSGSDGESYSSDHASLIPKRKRNYNPFYDPRSRRAAKVRRAMLER